MTKLSQDQEEGKDFFSFPIENSGELFNFNIITNKNYFYESFVSKLTSFPRNNSILTFFFCKSTLTRVALVFKIAIKYTCLQI